MRQIVIIARGGNLKRLLLCSYIAVLMMLMILVSGCSKESMEVKNGSYIFQAAEETDGIKPRIIIDDDKIHFIYDYLSSYASIGTYEMNGDILTMVTDDENYTYQFRIDNGALYFVEDEASVVKLIDERFGYQVTDESEFLLVEE